MKVSCLQENLARGLAVVGRAVATRSTLPVLSNILISTDESRLKLSATNLEIGVNCIEDEAGLARLGEFQDRAVLEVELVARLETLHVQATNGEVLPDDAGSHRVPLSLEFLKKFQILDGDGPVGAAVLVVVVAVADEAIHGHLGRLDNVFGYAPW